MLFKEKLSFNKRGTDYINQSITLNNDKTTFVKPMKTLSTNEIPSRTVRCAPCHRYIYGHHDSMCCKLFDRLQAHI